MRISGPASVLFCLCVCASCEKETTPPAPAAAEVKKAASTPPPVPGGQAPAPAKAAPAGAASLQDMVAAKRTELEDKMAATKLAKDSMQVFTALVAWSTDKDGALPDSLDELVTATLVEAPFLEGYKKHLIEYSGKGHAISDEGTLVVLRAKASADSKLEAVTLLNGSTKTEPARP